MKIIVKQGIRHILIGGFADLIDIGVFNLLFFIYPAQIIVKAISFLFAACIKYFGNKIWVFDKNDGHSIKELGQFAFITAIGLLINVVSFYCLSAVAPAKVDATIWREVSVIFAILITATWNFFGYKFIVFKK